MKNRLKELRKLHKYSQAELARQLGVSRQAVNGFESGKFDPSLSMAFKLAQFFNVTIEDIFIYEAEKSMDTLVKRVKNFFGFKFGFERFTEEAINVINFARNEAVRLQESQVEPEHILAGLLADPKTTSSQLLQANGAKLNIENNEDSFNDRERIKLSSESEFILELALQIVRLQDKRSIDTEHLLWGLIRLSETNKNGLSELLQNHNIDREALNNQLLEII